MQWLLPDGVYLTNMKQTNDTVAVAGIAQSNERVSELLRNLASGSPWLTRPELIEIVAGRVALTPKDERRVANFKMTVKMLRASDAQKAASAAAASGTAASAALTPTAAASAALLNEGRSGPQALVLPEAAVVARDVVLTELRQLVGAVSESPRFAEVRELTMLDIVHRPGQSLHQALSELPRAVSFGGARISGGVDRTLPAYEQHWQRAANAALALEGYVDSVGRLPDHIAWYVLRDLADLSAYLPYLDRDLSERQLPRLKAGEDLGVPYAMLTSAGHDALRLVAGEVRSRVPAHERSATSPEPLLSHAPVAGGDLSRAVSGYLRTVASHADDLSVADLRALTRLTKLGSDDDAC